MHPHLPRLFFSLVISLFLLAPFGEAGAVEMSRSSTVSQPRTSGTVQPASVRSQPQRQKLQKATPVSKTSAGYCCVNGKVEKSNATTCKRKRGELFPDQRSAQKACDAQSGYCCKGGEITKSNRGNCKRSRGEFFSKQTEAKQKCASTKGFCCAKGKVGADSKGSCDRKKGKFSLKKATANSLCAKQKGYCCKDGKVSPNTQGTCKSQRGNFSLSQKEAEQACTKQNGYCCVNGKVSRMTQGTCKQKKGTFSLKQQLAERACKAEKGFCCKDGKITNLTRGRCEQKKGNFSVRRNEVAKNCTAANPGEGQKNVKSQVGTKVYPKNATPNTATKPKRLTSTSSPGGTSSMSGMGGWAGMPLKKTQKFTDPLFKPKQDAKQFDDPLFKPKQDAKQFDDPLFKPTQDAKQFDDPLFKSPQGQKMFEYPVFKSTVPQQKLDTSRSTIPGDINSDYRMLPGTGNPFSGQASTMIAGSAVLTGKKLQTPGILDGLELATVGSNPPQIDTTGLNPDASLSMTTLTHALFIDQRLKLGGPYYRPPYGHSNASYGDIKEDVDLHISCGIGTLDDVDLYVTGGETYTNIHQRLDNNGHASLNALHLMSKEQFASSYCQEGEYYFDDNRGFTFFITYQCSMPNGESRLFEKQIKTPFSMACDRRRMDSFYAVSKKVNFKHTCPDDYQLTIPPSAPFSTPQVTFTTRGPNSPLECSNSSNTIPATVSDGNIEFTCPPTSKKHPAYWEDYRLVVHGTHSSKVVFVENPYAANNQPSCDRNYYTSGNYSDVIISETNE